MCPGRGGPAWLRPPERRLQGHVKNSAYPQNLFFSKIEIPSLCAPGDFGSRGRVVTQASAPLRASRGRPRGGRKPPGTGLRL